MHLCSNSAFLKTKRILILFLCFTGMHTARAQSPGSQVTVVLAGSGGQSGTFTYGNGRVDNITNYVTIRMQFHPYSPQPNGGLFFSTQSDFNGEIDIQSLATETQGGSSYSQIYNKTTGYTNYVGFATQTEFVGTNGSLASLSLALLDPNTISSQSLEPYRLFYDGTNGILTVWIRLPSPFIYQPYPSDDEAWQIPCSATVSNNGSSFTGLVVDTNTAKPLPGATVVIGGQTLTTDTNGSFSVPLLPPGPLTVQITDPDYIPYQATHILPPFSAIQQTFKLSQSPVNIALFRVSSFTADVKATDSIDAPIVPVTTPAYLSTASPLGIGVVADDVTPVLFQFNGTATNYIMQVTHNANSYNGSLSDHLFVLQNGTWNSTTAITIPSSRAPAYAYLSGLTWTDFSGTPANGVTVTLTLKVNLGGIATAVASTNFLVRPPPIALVHGIADDNTTWSSDFLNTLAIVRSPDFIIPVQYGVGSGADKTKWPNAYDRFDNLSPMLDDALRQQLETPLLANWAFTRYDAVGHSQGGVLLRMLCQTDRTGTVAPFTADRSPVDSANNFYRGRFRRVVTIGSPQNGSLIAWYIVNMQTTADFSPVINEAWFSALSGFNQPKFDPFGSQIAEINNPLWPTDSRIKFNCIRTTIASGEAPSVNILQNPPIYDLLGLWFPTASGMSRGQILLPNGSDGIVDFASEGSGANTPMTTITDNNIAHANIVPIPGIFELFGVPLNQSQTTFGEVAGEVGTLLNGPGGTFGSFQLPTLHSPTDLRAYQSILPSSIIVNGLIQFLAQPQYVTTNVSFALTTPTNLPSAGQINWSALVFGTNGLSTNGITVQVNTNGSAQVTVSVSSNVLGQVVLYASYVATNGTLVFASPVVVVSYAPGTTLNGIELTPPAATLSVGDALSTSIWGDYTNGTRCLLYIPTGQVNYSSSNTNVAVVDTNGTITLNSRGTATINASYQGFMAQTIISSAPKIIGNLYGTITTNGAYQLLLYSSVGTTNIIQVSTNLRTWSTLATIYSTNGVIEFQDNAKMQMRFYRVKQE